MFVRKRFFKIKEWVSKKRLCDLMNSMYRVTGRIFPLAQTLQLMNEKTKHNVLDVMATPDVYCQ